MSISDNLEYLRLMYIKENYESIIKKAVRSKMAYGEFLELLFEGEVIAKKERATERRLRAAKLPYHKSLEQYRWSHPQINRQQVEHIFRTDFIQKKENIIFLGGCGLGKTHMAVALAAKSCRKGHNVLFSTAVDIVNILTAARAQNMLDKALKKYVNPDLLVIDELGYLPIDKLGSDLLFQVVSRRYETGSIVVTCNRPFKEWAKIFNNDSTATSAILDRLLHHSEVVIIEGPSFRMKDKLKQ